MGRYRPPPPKKSPYITAEGYQVLERELSEIWARRAIVTQALSEAAAEGDRSENAEYIYRKKELREIDRRIRYLQKRLPDLYVVRQLPEDKDRIFFGAWVTLLDDDEHTSTWRIVGADEVDPERHYISIDSPVAKALLKRSVDDEVVVATPTGEQTYIVLDIRYEPLTV